MRNLLRYAEVGFLLLIGSADTSARLRVGDQPTRYLVETLGDLSTHKLVDDSTILLYYHVCGSYIL